MPNEIEIRNNKKRWIVVELISVNKGGTITFRYKGCVITRHCKHIKWEPTFKIAKEQGHTVPYTKADKFFKTKKKRRKNKKRKIFKSSKESKGDKSQSKRRVIVIAGHKVNFL